VRRAIRGRMPPRPSRPGWRRCRTPVRVDRRWPGAPPSRRRADRWHVIQNRCQQGGIGNVGGGDGRGQRQPTALTDQVELDPGLQRSTGLAPTWAPTLGADTHGVHTGPRPVQPALFAQPVQHLQVQLIEHPALAHSVRRRQQVAGEPQPSSCAGSSRHGVPEGPRQYPRQPTGRAGPVVNDQAAVYARDANLHQRRAGLVGCRRGRSPPHRALGALRSIPTQCVLRLRPCKASANKNEHCLESLCTRSQRCPEL
jgi:hypothetical protein